MTAHKLRLVVGLVALVFVVKACDRGRDSDEASREERTDRRVDEALTPEQAMAPREGLAAAIVIDVSGSMHERVEGEGLRPERKIVIARRAARDLVDQFARYADDHKDEPVQLGIYEFSTRRDQPDCRPIIAMGPPDRTRAAAALDSLDAEGGTPIGQAMITANRALHATGLTRRHLLLITDGENTDGVAPERVAQGLGRRPEAERPSLYFIAFDTDASQFNQVRDAGGLVLGAANAAELTTTLDALLRGSILIEK